MANLIITIISIALVAVAAIMGAYYGGTAFVQGQAKAFANTIVSQGDQISAAWSVYAAQNGGNYTAISDISTLSSAPDGQTYFASLPMAPPQVAISTLSAADSNGWASTSPWTGAWHMADLTNTSTVPSTTTSQNGVYFRLEDSQTGLNTCTYVQQIAAGSNAAAISVAAGILQTANTTRKFDCVYVGSASISAMTTSTPKYVYYRTY